MNPARKARPTKKHKRNNTLAMIVTVLLAIVMLGVVAYIWFPTNSMMAINEPEGFKTLTTHYLDIMKNLNSSQTKTEMASQLDPKYNQTDLFAWEGSKLTFQNAAAWSEDPMQILNSGDGICVQWSVVYVSACLALGYQSRLVVAVDTSSWSYIHVWAEDYYNGSWVHVDPSDKVWNNPLRYQSWDWGKYIGAEVKIYAFEDGKFEEVTSIYSTN